MHSELDQLLWHTWLKLQDHILANPHELRRRLDRRAKAYDHVPRPLCIALKASDRRINDMSACLFPRDADVKGREVEHTLLLAAPALKSLCRPVELYWGQHFSKLAFDLGAPRQVPRTLERRGHLRARRIPLLRAQRGLPVPLVDSPIPATAPAGATWEDFGHSTLLDPCAFTYTAPDQLLRPYWQTLRLPDSFEQTLHRTPIFRVQRGHLRFMHWAWLCPECHRDVNTLYLPLGAPDFAQLHNIPLPTTDDAPEPRLAFACKRCHGIANLARTPNSLHKSWSLLIAHLSTGLLFGREVPRPASFAATRANQATAQKPRSSPRRDELELYLAQTDLPIKEIARRMHWTYGAVLKELHLILKKRHLRAGRPALQRWWHKHHQTVAA